MNPRELLRELMRRSGDNPNSLAAALNQRTKQPQIYKFLEGIAKEPKRSTLLPVAQHYGVDIEAFYSEAVAAKVMENLKAGKPLNDSNVDISYTVKEPDGTYKVTLIQVKTAVQQIADHLESIDGYDRATAISLLTTLANSPDQHDIVAAGLTRLKPEARGAPATKQQAPAKNSSRAA